MKTHRNWLLLLAIYLFLPAVEAFADRSFPLKCEVFFSTTDFLWSSEIPRPAFSFVVDMKDLQPRGSIVSRSITASDVAPYVSAWGKTYEAHFEGHLSFRFSRFANQLSVFIAHENAAQDISFASGGGRYQSNVEKFTLYTDSRESFEQGISSLDMVCKR